jgi:23S rRNA pseudouridine1911/1915/1917 synthase
MTISFSWEIDSKYERMLVRDFLLKEVRLSRRTLTELKFNGGVISVNGNEVTVRYALKENDQLTIIFPNEQRSSKLLAERLPLTIVYEDEHVLVLNKQPNLATIPSKEHPTHSVANGLVHYYDQKGLSFAVHIVTRLDRDTSGLLLVAKHRFSHHLLSLQQKEGTVTRSYFAIVHGLMKDDRGKIEMPIGRNPASIIERMVREDGKAAITNYAVIDQVENKSLVKLKLETGRTHQIRVHLATIGHPLIGDTLYGGTRIGIARQALHCSELTFIHPFSKETMTFSCEMPDDMKQLWEKNNN